MLTMTSDIAWVGIDLGTQSVKVSAVTSDGHTLGHASVSLASHRDGVRHEQSPEDWWAATVECLRRVKSALPGAYRIGAIATCATSGTVVVADRKTGQPASPGVMYDDSRAATLTQEVNEAGASVWTRLGYTMQASWGLPAMVWLHRSKPLATDQVFLSQADIINWRLSGQALPSDSSHMLKMGFDSENMAWPTQELAVLGLPTESLNDVVEPGVIVGSTSVATETATGIAAGTPIVSGMTDGSAAQLAAGAVTAGQWNSVLGTTLVIKGSSDVRRVDPGGAIYCHRAPFGAGWWPGGASSTGARSISEHLAGVPVESLSFQSVALETLPIHYPLVGHGERFPFIAQAAEGFTLRGVLPTDTPRRFATIALGIALLERLCFDAVAFAGYPVDGEIALTGGGSRNREWNALRADTLARPVMVPLDTESSKGMAILARAALEAPTARGLSDTAQEMISRAYSLQPEETNLALISNRYRTLIEELNRRGWLSADLARFASGDH